MPSKDSARQFLSWEAVVEEFLLTKQAEGRSPRTLGDYRRHLLKFFSENPDCWPDYRALKVAVRRHFAQLSSRSATVYNLRREYLKAFFSWCVREDYIEANPVDGIPKRKNDGKPRHASPEEVKKLLSVLARNTYAGLRDYALILLQLDTGIRPGEALRLTPDYLNLPMLELYVPPTVAKTSQGRTVVISPQTARAIRKLLAVRPNDWDNSVPVFASENGTPMLVTSWAHRLRAYGKKAGVNITPYMLRHTAAIMALRNGGSPFYVQRQLGHASLTMTKRYVHFVEGDLHREHVNCSPVASILPQRSRLRKVDAKAEKG